MCVCDGKNLRYCVSKLTTTQSIVTRIHKLAEAIKEYGLQPAGNERIEIDLNESNINMGYAEVLMDTKTKRRLAEDEANKKARLL